MSHTNANLYDRINFVPDWYTQQVRRRRGVERQVVLMVVLLAGMLALWAVTKQQRDGLRLQATALQGQLDAARGQLTEVSKLQQVEQLLSRQLRVYDQIARPIGFHQINSALAALTPEPVFLKDLEAKVATVRETINVPGQTDSSGRPVTRVESHERVNIIVRGTAPSNVEIANYVGRLAGSSLFRDVKMMHSRQVTMDDAITRQFEIHMQVPLDRDYRVELADQEVAHAGE